MAMVEITPEVIYIIKFIDSLEKSSFEGWTEEEQNGYKTACSSIKRYVKDLYYMK